MSPLQRARVEKNMEYHAKLAEHYKKVTEPEEGEEQEQRQRVEVSEREMEEAVYLAKMHGDAAKMLRDVLGTFIEPAIVEAAVNRPVSRRIH